MKKLFLYSNEKLRGDLSMLTSCPALEAVDLGNCQQIAGDVSCFANCAETIQVVDLHWCLGIYGMIESFAKCFGLVKLDLSGCPDLTGSIGCLRELVNLEVTVNLKDRRHRFPTPLYLPAHRPRDERQPQYRFRIVLSLGSATPLIFY